MLTEAEAKRFDRLVPWVPEGKGDVLSWLNFSVPIVGSGDCTWRSSVLIDGIERSIMRAMGDKYHLGYMTPDSYGQYEYKLYVAELVNETYDYETVAAFKDPNKRTAALAALRWVASAVEKKQQATDEAVAKRFDKPKPSELALAIKLLDDLTLQRENMSRRGMTYCEHIRNLLISYRRISYRDEQEAAE